MLTALIIVAIILLSMVVLLAVPVEVHFDIQQDESRRNRFMLVWLAGMFRIPLTPEANKKRHRKAVRKRKNKTKQSGRRKVVALLRDAHFRRRLYRYVRRLIRSIKIKTLDLQVRLGLDDPADTGRLWSVLGPVSAILGEVRRANIRIEPEFTDEVFSLNSHGRISVVPLRVVGVSLMFFLSPQVIRALLFES